MIFDKKLGLAALSGTFALNSPIAQAELHNYADSNLAVVQSKDKYRIDSKDLAINTRLQSTSFTEQLSEEANNFLPYLDFFNNQNFTGYVGFNDLSLDFALSGFANNASYGLPMVNLPWTNNQSPHFGVPHPVMISQPPAALLGFAGLLALSPRRRRRN